MRLAESSLVYLRLGAQQGLTCTKVRLTESGLVLLTPGRQGFTGQVDGLRVGTLDTLRGIIDYYICEKPHFQYTIYLRTFSNFLPYEGSWHHQASHIFSATSAVEESCAVHHQTPERKETLGKTWKVLARSKDPILARRNRAKEGRTQAYIQSPSGLTSTTCAAILPTY